MKSKEHRTEFGGRTCERSSVAKPLGLASAAKSVSYDLSSLRESHERHRCLRTAGVKVLGYGEYDLFWRRPTKGLVIGLL